MSQPSSLRNWWLLWGVALLFGVALYLFPVSTRLTRLAGVTWFAVVWLSLIPLLWRTGKAALVLIGITLAATAFLLLPARTPPPVDVLRQDYVEGLRRFEGARYYWGGESARGIDCSGLIRRGLINALACRGLLTADPGLVRQALSLWWHDCTAERLGEAVPGLTSPVLQTRAINELDHSVLAPGDLAVTSGGLHVMAYLGAQRWIEADPALLRVVEERAPSEMSWFNTPMNIVRWAVLR